MNDLSEFLNWLDTNINKIYVSNEFIEDISNEIDIKNLYLLKNFYEYLKNISAEQLYFYEINKDDETIIDFKFLNKFYRLNYNLMLKIINIEYLNIIPLNYITLDNDLSETELKERELIEYIIINKDLNISHAKYSVHTCHASTIAALKEQHTNKFKYWYKDGLSQKKIILKASQNKLEELEKQFYSVRDSGLTEVDPNTLIAVSLGIMSRKEAKIYIKRLQLWN